MLSARLDRAIERRRRLGLPSADTTAYRLVHGEADELGGLTVDVYDRHLVASVYIDDDPAHEQRWMAALAELGYEGVYLKRRPRKASDVSAGERRERAPERALVGRDAPATLVVHERGVPFEVRLGEGFSTGLFLDQRENRARVAAEAHGKAVLNLFAYTCSFGLVAARAGARRTVNIDVAKSVLERGRRNYALSSLHSEAHHFLARDVLETLPRLAKRDERFELVVFDPPSYASTKSGRFRVESDYAELCAIAMTLVADGGSLLACTNHHGLTERDLGRALEQARSRANRAFSSINFLPPPGDHPVAPGRVPHLKSAWVRF